jgi:hypothetical protein
MRLARLLTSASALVALIVVAEGCGGGDDDEQENTSSKEPQHAIEPDAQAREESLLVQLTDLPAGWRGADPDDESGDGDECFRIDLSQATKIGDADSQEFSMGENNEISSSASIYATEAEAQRVLEVGADAFVDQDIADCLKDSLNKFLEEEGNDPGDFEVGDPELGELSFPPPSGVEEARAFQIMMPLEAEGVSVDYFIEIVVLRQADALASVETFGLNDPLKPELRDALAQTVADRMVATSGATS